MIRHVQPKPQAPERVVVLGGSGFLGRHLADHLAERGVAMVAPRSRSIDLEQPTAVDRLRDLLRPNDAVVFAAALTPDRGRDVRTLMRNLTMAEHVVAAIAAVPCSHLVYISSDAVYADGLTPVRESSPAEPGSLYGQMHLTREKIVAEASRAAGCPYLVLRPCALYGPGDTHNSYGPNRFVRTALTDGTVRLFGDGDETRDHLHVADFVRLLGLALGHRTDGVLNVATGRSVSFNTVAKEVIRLCPGARIEPQPRGGPVTHRRFDVSAVLRALPAFRFTKLTDGLADCVRAGGTKASRPAAAPASSALVSGGSPA
jgi:nucleoside-diphosphate-sugar epimerase